MGRGINPCAAPLMPWAGNLTLTTASYMIRSDSEIYSKNAVFMNNTSVLNYLKNSSERFPDKIAFADPEESVTFRELRERGMRIGSALSRVLPPRSCVPVFMPKGVKAVSVFMGAAYAGCFYSMLDMKQPVSRLESVLDSLDASYIVTSREVDEASLLKITGDSAAAECYEEAGSSEGADDSSPASAKRPKLLYYEDLEAASLDEALLAARQASAADTDPLYVNFTSGSTGRPKGVVVCHRSVIDFIDNFVPIMGITENDVIGNQAPFDFDVSVKDIYSGLMTGATVRIIPQKYFSIPTQLIDYLIDGGVTVLIWAVSALTLVTKLHGFTYKVPASVRKVIFSGEVMPVKHLNLWREALPGAEFYNVYGPTEVTCNCTWYKIDRPFTPEETIPIGRAFPNEKVFLLDEEDRPVNEPGIEGEICVAGTALALGYYRNEEATSAAFVQNPLHSDYSETIYRTGDLAKYLDDGDLLYIGRRDLQIKHMGHRIELGEIEHAMNAVPEVGRSCCLFIKEKIVAFYTGEIEKRDLAAALKTMIPDYMVPNIFVPMEDLPINKNGKTDRRALAEGYRK